MNATRAILLICGALLVSAPQCVWAQAVPIPGAPAMATSRPGSVEGLQIVVSSVSLDPITVEELAGGQDPIQGQSAGHLQANTRGRSLQARADLHLPSGPVIIRREIKGVWRYTRPVDQRNASLPIVRVELDTGPEGTMSDAFTNNELRVRVRPGRVRRVDSHPGVEVFEGDVILEIPVEALRSSGRFRGRLRLVSDHL